MRKTLPLVLLCTAALAASAQVAFPLPGSEVPITLQSAVVCFCGLTLRGREISAALLLYLALGAVGLPVFAGGEGGWAVLRGPSGGYLVGFLAAWPLMALAQLVFRGDPLLVRTGGAAFLGHLVILTLGVLWLHEVQVWTWYRTLEAGFWPFLPGVLLKSLLAGGLAAWVLSSRAP